jgi:glycyl-tRNA synthetase beta chain
MRQTLLIEIGCEEIPARMLSQAAKDVADSVLQLLDRAELAHGEPRRLWTPRRLAVLIPETQTATASRTERLLGPPASAAFESAGHPTKAAEGWARKQGIEPSRIQRVATDKGDYAAAEVVRPAQSVGAVLASGFERAIGAISFPKTMRWGVGQSQWVRPVHWLVALCGQELLGLTLFGVKADRVTRGHRGLDLGPHLIPSADEWLSILESHRVVADPIQRKMLLHDALRVAAQAQGGELVEDAELLDESADIVEWPSALAGAFEVKYVAEVPRQVLATCLRHHQKAFSVVDAQRKLLPRFAVAINTTGDPEGHIRRGHEWVNSGRLADAAFFWNEDKKQRLEARRARLDGIVFHRDLGTFGEKTERIKLLVDELAQRLAGGTVAREHLVRAAELSRCDLSTGLVGEFPELQGVVGQLLAQVDGEPAEVCDAMGEFYLPAGPDDPLPLSRAGRLLGIADRLDTLARCFAAGLQPTGSKDPFGLRRSGNALIRLTACEADLDLASWLDRAGVGAAREAALQFLFERLEAVAPREILDLRYDEIAAVRALANRQFDVADLLARLRALRVLRDSADFLALAAASKRVRNILDQARDRGDVCEPVWNAASWSMVEESALSQALTAARGQVETARREREYGPGLRALAALRPAVDSFFDKVLVLDPDATKRAARLSLLAGLAQLTSELVDMSQIVIEGELKR